MRKATVQRMIDEALAVYTKTFHVPQIECYSCRCLIRVSAAAKVMHVRPDQIVGAIPQTWTQYFCHRCKPDYDTVREEWGAATEPTLRYFKTTEATIEITIPPADPECSDRMP